MEFDIRTLTQKGHSVNDPPSQFCVIFVTRRHLDVKGFNHRRENLLSNISPSFSEQTPKVVLFEMKF